MKCRYNTFFFYISQTWNSDNGISIKSASVICYELINFDELEAPNKLVLEIGVDLKIKFVAILILVLKKMKMK